MGSGVLDDESSHFFTSCFPFHADVEFSQAALKAGAKCNIKLALVFNYLLCVRMSFSPF